MKSFEHPFCVAVDVAERDGSMQLRNQRARSRTAAAIPILRGNFPVFRCSARSRTAVDRTYIASSYHQRHHRIPHYSMRFRRPRFPACRLFVRYARLSRIEVSLNFARVVSPTILPTIFVFDFSPSLPLSRVIREMRKRESDTIPGITIPEQGMGSLSQDDEVLDLRNEFILRVGKRYRKTFPK